MEATARIRIGEDLTVNLVLTPLEAIRVVASRFGFSDLDIQPEVFGFRIVATDNLGKELTGKGDSRESACENLMEKIVNA